MTATDPVLPPEELGRVHVMGIGGAGMSGIAHILLARGVSLSGCDARDSDTLAGLRAAGASAFVGHDPAHLDGVDTLVLSSAVRRSNPEVAEAAARGRPHVLSRAAALASVMVDRRGVAVSGTHGKTTTTSMLATTLSYCGADPSYLIGGAPTTGEPAARHGSGDIFVTEADESDGSFLQLSPYAAVVTNVEADHLDTYGTPEAVHDAFARFLDRIDSGGFLVCCADDAGSRQLTALARERGIEVHTYGESPDADVGVDSYHGDVAGACAFDVTAWGTAVGRVRLGVPGRHNALNAAAVIAVAMRLGYDEGHVVDGLAEFAGVQRRFEERGIAGDVSVYDSYAHHPTELAADLRTARDIAGVRRVVAAFQPHLYSRTRFFAAEFGRALALADAVVVLDVYAAREDPDPAVTGKLVADAVPLPADRVWVEPDFDAVPRLLVSLAEPADVILILGAGDITLLGPRVVELLRERGPVPEGDGA